MLPMKTILASQFWNQEIESTHSLEAVARSLPCEPPPLGITQSNPLNRSQQLLLFQRFLALPCTPSYAVDRDDAGGWVLDRVLASLGGQNWWTTLMGRIRVQRMCRQKKSVSIENRINGCIETNERTSSNLNAKQLNATSDQVFHEEAKGVVNSSWIKALKSRLLDPSLYALSGRMRMQIGPNVTLTSSAELNSLPFLTTQGLDLNCDISRTWQGRVALRQKLRKHEMALEAAFHEKCVDRNAQYWDIPQSLSIDLSSNRPGVEGLRYRFGVYHSSGTPQAVRCQNPTRVVPQGALPGTKAQAAFSVEKKISLWKERTNKPKKRGYNIFAARPQISTSAIMGGFLSYKIGNSDAPVTPDDKNNQQRSTLFKPVTADMFASLGVTAQFGSFERLIFDHTLLSMRLDCGAKSAFSSVLRKSDPSSEPDTFGKTDAELHEHGSPTLAATFQQQILGPVRARVDTRFGLSRNSFFSDPKVMEVTYGVDCSVKSLGAAKLVAWYSPSRKEGMAELRFLEP